MQKCIEVLDRDPSVILCYSKTKVIDEHGNMLGDFTKEVDTTSPYPHDRLYNVLAIDALCIQLYGVMRSSALRSTKVYAGYYGCDRNTLFELGLLGKMQEIPEYLFFHRLYPGALGIAMNSGKSVDELLVVDPGTDWKYRATAKTIYRNYYSSISNLVPSPVERIRCYGKLTGLILQKAVKRIGRKRQNSSS
jgi:hypothetical protein